MRGQVWIIACIEDTAAIRKITDQLKSKGNIIEVLDDGECIAEYPGNDTCYVATDCESDGNGRRGVQHNAEIEVLLFAA